MKLNTVIVEDNQESRVFLKRILSDIPYVNIEGETDNGDDGFQLIVQKRPHVAFLDIDLPGMSGLQIARVISELNNADVRKNTYIIFATGYNGFALDAFDCYAYDYLLKPYSADRVKFTMDKIHSNLTNSGSKKQTKVIVKTDSSMALLDPDDIIIITRQGRETYIDTTERRIKTTDCLEIFEKNLDSSMFMRCHKSYIVNIKKIKEIIPSGKKSLNLVMADTNNIAIMTRDRLKEFKGLL